MKKLGVIKDQYQKAEISAEEALDLIFGTYLIEDSELASSDLSIREHGYGLYQLKQRGQFMYEGESTQCRERAREILDKH